MPAHIEFVKFEVKIRVPEIDLRNELCNLYEDSDDDWGNDG